MLSFCFGFAFCANAMLDDRFLPCISQTFTLRLLTSAYPAGVKFLRFFGFSLWLFPVCRIQFFSAAFRCSNPFLPFSCLFIFLPTPRGPLSPFEKPAERDFAPWIRLLSSCPSWESLPIKSEALPVVNMLPFLFRRLPLYPVHFSFPVMWFPTTRPPLFFFPLFPRTVPRSCKRSPRTPTVPMTDIFPRRPPAEPPPLLTSQNRRKTAPCWFPCDSRETPVLARRSPFSWEPFESFFCSPLPFARPLFDCSYDLLITYQGPLLPLLSLVSEPSPSFSTPVNYRAAPLSWPPPFLHSNLLSVFFLFFFLFFTP